MNIWRPTFYLFVERQHTLLSESDDSAYIKILYGRRAARKVKDLQYTNKLGAPGLRMMDDENLQISVGDRTNSENASAAATPTPSIGILNSLCGVVLTFW